jgi:hypothetical protein
MKLEVNQVEPYATEDGKPGLLKLWICRDRRDGPAVVVMTELPGDTAPSPLAASLAAAASAAMSRHHLANSRTLWFHRRVDARRRERWAEIEFRMEPRGGPDFLLHDPEPTPSSRVAAEIAAGCAFPEISDDEH